MMIRILAILALLGCMGSASAFRVLGQPERPFELTLSQLTLPKDTSGSVTLHEGDTGRVSTRRFVDGAKFVVDGRELSYADFLQIMNDLRVNSTTNDRTVANVYVDVVTERVTRVAVRRPSR
ncbi:MAG: hypothetical protein ABI640_03170 [Gammaproteobacteria bacterium]